MHFINAVLNFLGQIGRYMDTQKIKQLNFKMKVMQVNAVIGFLCY